jgi:hypothetical protein
VVRRRAADVVDLRRARPDLVFQVGRIPSDGAHPSFKYGLSPWIIVVEHMLVVWPLYHQGSGDLRLDAAGPGRGGSGPGNCVHVPRGPAGPQRRLAAGVHVGGAPLRAHPVHALPAR